MPTSPLLTASESTASTRLREGGATVRKAKLPDAVNIFDLVNSLSGDGTLLRRSYAEICENVRDFTVAHIVEPDGATDILVSQAYRWAFTRGHRYGYAAAYAVLIFAILAAQTFFADKEDVA